MNVDPIPEIDLAAFLRLFEVRGSRVMWFLGAGASRGAGVKTAIDMIWDFKRKIFLSEKRLPPNAITDIGEPEVRAKLQDHFDKSGKFPSRDSEDEYAAYFEATYTSASDRRDYIDQITKGASPSFGHGALAFLMDKNFCRIVWTTNFDRLVEDACSKVFGTTGRLTVGDIADPARFESALTSGRWPVYAKLHGDFQSDRLKNTSSELREQDQCLRRCLINASTTHGLAVIGYSGRDESVLNTLVEALANGRGFPAGLYWFKRYEDSLFPKVVELIRRASSQGIEARIVSVESFDELFSDIVRYVPALASDIASLPDISRPRLRRDPLPQPSKRLPVIRTNALPITSYPLTCRLVDCQIGGSNEVEGAIAEAKTDIVAKRTRKGVIAFGSDEAIRKTFEKYTIDRLDTYAISPGRLEYETSERALVRQALFAAIKRRSGFQIRQKRSSCLLVPGAAQVDCSVFREGSRQPIKTLGGKVPKTHIDWSEACELRLDWHLDRLWLLFDPRVVIDVTDDTPELEIATAREFIRELRAQRRNSDMNAILWGWIRLLVGRDDEIRMRAFETTNGYDAEFVIATITGFAGLRNGN